MKNFWQNLKPPILALAPMAGVTDQAFRRMCKKFGADVVYTEFASANALAFENPKTFEMIAFEEEERPVVCQIFGSDPHMMFKAAQKLREHGFDGVDINFGCPAYKVTKHGGGVCLMRNLPLVYELVQATIEGAKSMPVSIKIRGSIKSEDKQSTTRAIDLVQKIKGLPVSALMIHGRSFEKPFDGEPDVKTIKDVVDTFPGIVLANGGIHTPEDAKKILEETGAHGVGIARGAWGQPWIFKQIKEYLATGTYEAYSFQDVIKQVLEHAQLALSTKGNYGIIELRKHLSHYIKGVEGASELRSRLVRADSLEQIQEILAK